MAHPVNMPTAAILTLALAATASAILVSPLRTGLAPMPRLALMGRLAAEPTAPALPPMRQLRPACRAALASPSMLAAQAEEPVVTDTAVRSFVKAAGWRFTAGIVTACSSYFFTGSLATAASIVGWDLFSKSGTMFIGERLWNKVAWGKTKSGDTSTRSAAKAIAWRVFAACNTLFAAVVLTKGKTGIASKIAGADSIIKTILFFFYERAWSVVEWGTQTATDRALGSATDSAKGVGTALSDAGKQAAEAVQPKGEKAE